MSRNRPTAVSSKLHDIINQLDHVAYENRLKVPEPPPCSIKYPGQPDEDSRKKKS